MKNFITWFVSVLQHAKSKVTTYFALGVAGVSQVSEHAEELHSTWPDLMRFLPPSKMLVSITHYVLTVLGFVIVFTRVRRLVGTPKAPLG
jgi:hypothetical protein